MVLIQGYLYIIAVFNPLIACCVLYMLRLDFIFSSSPWYRATVLPIFFYFFDVPPTQNYCYAASIFFGS